MAERGVSRTEVLDALTHPIQTINADRQRVESQGWIDRAGKRLLLRVLCEQRVVTTVVTVIATSKFEKYGVRP
jgi:hypothetical protein